MLRPWEHKYGGLPCVHHRRLVPRAGTFLQTQDGWRRAAAAATDRPAGRPPQMKNPRMRAVCARVSVNHNSSVRDNGKGKVRTHEAAREHRDDWARGPRQDDADGGDYADPGVAGHGPVRGVRP